MPNLQGALKAFEAGVDGLVVEGTEGGGFKGYEEIGLAVLIQAIKKEIDLLKNVKIIVALGKIAFDACIQFYKETYFLKNKDYLFAHASKYQLPDKKILIGCYHPSPRNVNTKRINLNMMVKLFKNAKKINN